MYMPKHFAETDSAAMHALMRAHPLGTWVSHGADELLVNHIPFHLDAGAGEHGTLIGHVARANPVWQSLSASVPSVVVFQGPQAYVSPAWYPGKKTDGKVVPTWNYAVVHAHGYPRVVEDRARLLAIVTMLTQVHEAGRPAPWQVADAPAAYVEAMLNAIVGIEIPLTRLTGKWKMSQNRTVPDRAGVMQGLLASGDSGAADVASQVARFIPQGGPGPV